MFVRSRNYKMNLLLFIWFCGALIQLSVANDDKNVDNTENSEVATFRKLFIQKRIIQLGAIKQLKGYEDEKLNKMLIEMTKKMLETLSANKNTLEASGISQAVKDLPVDTKVRNSLALVLENTCLASELVLNFPKYMHKLLKENKAFNDVFRWCLSFSYDLVAENLVDEPTRELYRLALVEIGVIQKEAGYQNPFKEENDKPTKKLDFVDPPEPKKKAKKKLARGPRMAKSEL